MAYQEFFAPRIIIHGKSYSSNSGINDLNSQPEASNSHSHSIMYPIYPNTPTISSSRQSAQNQQAVSSSNNSIYNEILNSLNDFNSNNSQSNQNSIDFLLIDLMNVTRRMEIILCYQIVM